ncbi:helix-turn-helix domain-containing protein [Streptomyces sp. 549]|uniref:helix-turn-helix domain-containing protein n=1 Tax=Streptomyces sp. 549 TaxID=3049076 RepID=UPI0024C2E42E|nr:helix-turn-helix domain-containing protein [Streptomyces sp. 549]MDK1476788.1 helix-turn-helix domain-containing protein [Streptomyces sp. 549]
MSIAIPEPDLTAPVLYRVTEVAALLRLSRSVVYEQIRAKRLRTVKQGAARRIPASAINEYVALLEREAGENK